MRKHLSKLAEAPINATWKALKLNNSSHDCSGRTRHLLSDAEKVNEYFAGISCSRFYNTENVTAFRPSSQSDCHDYHPIYAYEVERMLSKVSKTAPGPDNLPYWIFKNCSYELAEAIAHIFNCSLRSGVLPCQWLTAVITPAPKISNPQNFSDFRPISVTPLLSRVLEKFVTNRWLQPAIAAAGLIDDQFAFRRTGSTTCALTYFMHHITRMLENNSFVRCLLVDFSKAFDRVAHVVLLQKLSKLKLPEYILNWLISLISFLTGRSHTTRCLGTESIVIYL